MRKAHRRWESSSQGRTIPGTPTDAVVVLTGGPLRVQAGLAVLEAGQARKLLVSGVHPSVEITERQGRDFAITGAEVMANEQSRQLQFSGDVKLLSSDGFELATATATFNEQEGIVRAPGAVSFHTGAISGTGVGMTYDQNTDVRKRIQSRS